MVATLVAGFLLILLLGWRFSYNASVPPAPEPAIEREGRRFVSLALTLGLLAPAEVDSYFGPAGITPVTTKPSLPELRADIGDLAADLRSTGNSRTPRQARLAERTDRLLALVNSMGPVPPQSWDEQARALYGLPPLQFDSATFARARAALDHLLPGGEPLAERVEAYRARFLIPEARRVAVFQRALAECRRRTLLHWDLPPSERMDVEWTDDVGAAWHRYRGNFRSTLQINPNAVAFLGSAIDVACHEGYPGHHVQFLLAEAAPGGMPVEDRVALLRSPGSILREGAADFGVSLAFPPADRLAFERDVLMPLAGLPQAEAERFEAVRALLDQLSLAAYPILRAYHDGALDEPTARAALTREAFVASPQQLLGFADAEGAFVAGYSLHEQVRRTIMAPAGGDPWQRLRALLAAADDAPFARAPAEPPLQSSR